MEADELANAGRPSSEMIFTAAAVVTGSIDTVSTISRRHAVFDTAIAALAAAWKMAGNVPPLTSTLPVPLEKYVPTVTAKAAAGDAIPLVKPRTVHTTAPLPLATTSDENVIVSVRRSSKQLQDDVAPMFTIADIPRRLWHIDSIVSGRSTKQFPVSSAGANIIPWTEMLLTGSRAASAGREMVAETDDARATLDDSVTVTAAELLPIKTTG